MTPIERQPDGTAADIASGVTGGQTNGKVDDLPSWDVLDGIPPIEVEPIDEPVSKPAPAEVAGEIRPFAVSNLAALAREGVKPPELLCDDMLYRGRLHALVGDSGAGKTTLLYYWTVLELKAGQSVAILDEEDGDEDTVERLVALGATPDDLERLIYLDSPGRQWDDADRRGFEVLLTEHKPRLIGYVSTSAILTMAGKNDNWTVDTIPIYKLFRSFGRTSNAAGVIVDHVPLSDTSRARGSTAKRQMLDVQYVMELVTPFNRQQSGMFKLTIPHKDRRGYLHRSFDVRVEVDDGAMALAFTKTAFVERKPGKRKGERPFSQQKVLDALHALRPTFSTPTTRTKIGDWLKENRPPCLKGNTISGALYALEEEGLIQRGGKNGRETLWYLSSGDVSREETS